MLRIAGNGSIAALSTSTYLTRSFPGNSRFIALFILSTTSPRGTGLFHPPQSFTMALLFAKICNVFTESPPVKKELPTYVANCLPKRSSKKRQEIATVLLNEPSIEEIRNMGDSALRGGFGYRLIEWENACFGSSCDQGLDLSGKKTA